MRPIAGQYREFYEASGLPIWEPGLLFGLGESSSNSQRLFSDLMADLPGRLVRHRAYRASGQGALPGGQGQGEQQGEQQGELEGAEPADDETDEQVTARAVTFLRDGTL